MNLDLLNARERFAAARVARLATAGPHLVPVVFAVEDAAAMTAPIDLLVAKYPQYQEIRPAGPVILVRVHTWRGWTAV